MRTCRQNGDSRLLAEGSGYWPMPVSLIAAYHDVDGESNSLHHWWRSRWSAMGAQGQVDCGWAWRRGAGAHRATPVPSLDPTSAPFGKQRVVSHFHGSP